MHCVSGAEAYGHSMAADITEMLYRGYRLVLDRPTRAYRVVFSLRDGLPSTSETTSADSPDAAVGKAREAIDRLLGPGRAPTI